MLNSCAGVAMTIFVHILIYGMLFVYGMDLVVVNASKLYGTPALTPLGYQGYMPYPTTMSLALDVDFI